MINSKQHFYDLLKGNPELAKNLRVEMSGPDLLGLVDYCVDKVKETIPAKVEHEEYLTSEEMAKILKISLVTLWSWDRKNITRPLRIGNAKRYRRSDLEKILSNA